MTEPEPRPAFPWWVVVGGLVLAAGYLPTLAAPFDFIDDGNLVYPAPAGTTLAGHASLWWEKVCANVEHLGPFRPTLWVHWEVFANTLGADPFAWRAVRLLWCGLAASGLLWLLRELKLPPGPAVVAAAAAMWNPYRNEIWTSLTLAEGVAMPYAMLALVAARKATTTERPWRWDAVAVGSLFMVLGCKNTFAALVLAMLVLRLLPDGASVRDGLRRGRWAAVSYLLPLAMPAAHFVYFKMNWHPGQYETPGPSLTQAKQFASWMKGAVGLDFLGAGIVLAAVAVAWKKRPDSAVLREHRAAVACGVTLLLAGAAVYLPFPMMAARYTMPAVWGADVLFAVLLAGLATLPACWPKRAAWTGVAVGLAAVTIANVGRQERVAARSGMLWQVAHELERSAPQDARVMWVSGESSKGELNAEEGIHLAWHLLNRGRGDVRIMLFDRDGKPVPRVELPAPDGIPDFRIAAGPEATTSGPGWASVRDVSVGFRYGAKRHACRIDGRVPATISPAPLLVDAIAAGVMKAGFEDPSADLATLLKRAAPSEPRP